MALIMKIASLRRYVAYDASNEANFAAISAEPSTTTALRTTGSGLSQGPRRDYGDKILDPQIKAPGISLKPPRKGETSMDTAAPSDAMADLHLSGSDPRLFPGIFTREHRSGSLRNLHQGDEWAVDSSEPPGDEDDD